MQKNTQNQQMDNAKLKERSTKSHLSDKNEEMFATKKESTTATATATKR